MTVDDIRNQYGASEHSAKRLQKNIVEQIEQLLTAKGISLGVPLETRIKSLASIEEKIQRKALSIQDIHELDDLVGIRLILLFKRDMDAVCELLNANFNVVSEEDTSSRLGEAQFGYHSRHFVVRIPQSWIQIPTFAGLDAFKCELQVRTLAQHIWATASHKLQYKREESVPPPLRRTIHRISALLETVDLEFDRILDERNAYLSYAISSPNPSEPLNVDIIGSILDKLLPPENRDHDETYDELLRDLTHFRVTTSKQLHDMLELHMKEILEEDEREYLKHLEDEDDSVTSNERSDAGVFFTHVGLARQALREQFGDDVVTNYLFEEIRRRIRE